MDKNSSRQKIVQSITTPLGFFVLALLIVESFLATVLLGADLDMTHKVIGMWAGVILFVLVMIAVFLLVWFKPTELTFDKEAHLTMSGRYIKKTDSENTAVSRLREYWKPNGKINNENENRLKDWMKSNGIDTKSITFFLVNDIFSNARHRAIDELELGKQ